MKKYGRTLSALLLTACLLTGCTSARADKLLSPPPLSEEQQDITAALYNDNAAGTDIVLEYPMSGGAAFMFSDIDGSGEDEAEESGPILELTDDHVTLKVGDYFNFYDYIKTMEDRDGSELSRYIHLAGEVNTYQPGDYTITYQITSPIDGKTASKDLLVTVEY